MGFNTEIKKSKLEDITRELFAEAIELSFRDGIKEHAPLGYRGDTILLYGESRRSEVSVFNHSGVAKLLITDTVGNFIFHGSFDLGLGTRFIANHYYNIFCLVENHITNVVPKKKIFESF